MNFVMFFVCLPFSYTGLPFLNLLCVNASHDFLSCGQIFHNQLQNNKTMHWFSHRMEMTGYISKRPIYSQLRMECEPIQINSIILIIAFSLGCNKIFLKATILAKRGGEAPCLPSPFPLCQCWWKSLKTSKQTNKQTNKGKIKQPWQ